MYFGSICAHIFSSSVPPPNLKLK